jgi:GTP-binding protein HflX
LINLAEARQRAIVVHPVTRSRTSNPDPEEPLAEAIGLSEALGLDVREARAVNVKKIIPATYLGGGLIDELQANLQEHKAELLVFDGELTPVQQRNLETRLDAKVLDRTGLILEIFSMRARTKEGRLQVELARIAYERSRLVRTWTHLERQRGGKGFLAGPGERQIESDRRALSDKALALQRQLEKVRRTRHLHRKARKNRDCPIVALVGYTNAGKSTLFNKLTEADVFVEDMLFATLDPTIRDIHLPNQKKAALSDTVGFISALPTELIAAFRATLEEVTEADLILHVRDIASRHTADQKRDVLAVLENLREDGQEIPPVLEIWNKIDLLSQEDKQDLRKRAKKLKPEPMLLSATTGEGVEEMLEALASHLSAGEKTLELDVPADDSEVLGWLHQHGRILTCEANQTGSLHCVVTLDKASYGRFQHAYPAFTA